jgi:hypothetical protein
MQMFLNFTPEQLIENEHQRTARKTPGFTWQHKNHRYRVRTVESHPK